MTPTAMAHDLDAAPYRFSWIDRLVAAIRRMPIPGWSAYALMLVVGQALVAVLRLRDGQPPTPAVLARPPVFLVWTTYLLALTHYLNAVARDRMARFRPALDVDDATFSVLERRLITMPAGPVLAHGVLWVAVGGAIMWAILDRVLALGFPRWEIALTVAAYFVGGGVIYHTVHQLREVSRLYARVAHVDLHRLDPLHAFAGLTAQSALGWILLLYLTTLLVPRDLWSPAVELSWLVIAAVAAAAFAVPLFGMHRRLVVAKHAALGANGARLSRVSARIHEAIDAEAVDRLDGLSKVSGLLLAERERLAKVSTWPWDTGTLRGFVTALLLPIVLRLGQQAVEGLIGLGLGR